MVMHRLYLFLMVIALSVPMDAETKQMLDELDAAIKMKAEYVKAKENKIELLKKSLASETRSSDVLNTLDKLFNEYHVFKFDSAMAYANKGLEEARRQKNDDYIKLFSIHRSEILAIGGLYSESVNNLNALDTAMISRNMLFKYYQTYFSTYLYWSNYCNDQAYSPLYMEKAKHYLKQAIQIIDEQSPYREYFLGEYYVYIKPDTQKAREHYQNLLKTGEEASRAYAMASFALAGNYLNDGDSEKYEEYIIKAAISDLKNCTMETMALQTLAMHLFETGEDDIVRAERYINLSMDDANFYNNRLRMIQNSRALPQIMTAYQATIERQNNTLRLSIVFISLLVVGLLLTAYYIYRQNRILSSKRKELADSNLQLTDLNGQLAESNDHQALLNQQLKELNQKLVDTNDRRENLASIYIDLCAKYIDKLGKYQTLVKRKIKANQAQELLQTISSTRISEEDAATFLHRFDKAFLELYPTFVDEFNALFPEESRIQQKSPTTLTTELRTFALIRLGVKNTADIAGLLFLSTQTIYNCRSVVKNKAISKDTFDEDIQKLCVVIR